MGYCCGCSLAVWNIIAGFSQLVFSFAVMVFFIWIRVENKGNIFQGVANEALVATEFVLVGLNVFMAMVWLFGIVREKFYLLQIWKIYAYFIIGIKCVIALTFRVVIFATTVSSFSNFTELEIYYIVTIILQSFSIFLIRWHFQHIENRVRGNSVVSPTV